MSITYPHRVQFVILTTLIRTGSQTNTIATAASNSSSHVATDPSIPPVDGTCHLMKLPTELRLAIAEDIFDDFFKRLRIGLYPPFLVAGESRLPYARELFSVLHVNRAFRLETIDLCTRLAKESAEEVASHPPGSRGMRHRPHIQLKSKHCKILRILRKAKVSAGEHHSS